MMLALSNVNFNMFPATGNVNGTDGSAAAAGDLKPSSLALAHDAPTLVNVDLSLGLKSSENNVSEHGRNPFLTSMFEDDDDETDFDVDIDAYVDDDTEMQILYSTPYPPLQVYVPSSTPPHVVPSSPALRPLALPPVSSVNPSQLHSSSYIIPLPALPPHLNPLRPQKHRRPCFPLRRRVGESPLKREVKVEEESDDDDEDSVSESGSVSSLGMGSRASSYTSAEEECDFAMEVDVEEVAYFAPPGLPPPSSRASVATCPPQAPSPSPAPATASTTSIPITPDVTRAMQDFHTTINRTLNLLSPPTPMSSPTAALSPSDKSHTIAQISRCIFIVQSRIEELGDVISSGAHEQHAHGWFTTSTPRTGTTRDMLMEKQLLEVELCGMESVWREVRGRLVGSGSGNGMREVCSH